MPLPKIYTIYHKQTSQICMPLIGILLHCLFITRVCSAQQGQVVCVSGGLSVCSPCFGQFELSFSFQKIALVVKLASVYRISETEHSEATFTCIFV